MDIVEEILTRLPVKHVLRCKLLSKSCYNLIKTPSFVKKHLFRQRSDSSKITVEVKKNIDDNWIVYTLQLTSSSCEGESQLFTPPYDLLLRMIVGSCNGLFVFSSSAILDNLVVCNPATRKYMSVPKPPLERNMLQSNHIEYYTDALGFAYDAKTGNYKLIRIGRYYIYGRSSRLIQVWNMTTNSWKQINPAPLPSGPFRFRQGLLVNGILYWLVGPGGHSSSRRDPIILSFDPTNDKFGEIALPKEAEHHYVDADFIDFMDSLALSLSQSQSRDFHCFDIWVMGSSGSVWTKKFSIGPFSREVRTTRMCMNGNIILYGISRKSSRSADDCMIILYDPDRSEVVREANVKGLGFIDLRSSWSFADSLVTVPQTTTGCCNDDDEEEEDVNKLLRPALLGVFLGCVGLSLHLLLRTRC